MTTYNVEETIEELIRRGKIPRPVSPATLYGWIADGRLPGSVKEQGKRGEPWVIPESAIEKFPNVE